MPCQIPEEKISQTIEFHGHSCPGLAIGIRAAELALREFGGPDAELVTVAETDMCGVDAIQFLTCCTYGKGNFIHRDLGKMAFSFHDRSSGRGIRALLRPEARGGMDRELGVLMGRIADNTATDEDRKRSEELRGQLQRRFMELALEELFDIQPLDSKPPRPARIMESLVCAACGETVMESRTRRFGGETLCIPCFGRVEQKI